MSPVGQSSLDQDELNLRYRNMNGQFTYPYKSSSEYAAAVNQWLWQCYHWQYIASSFPYYLSLAASNPSLATSGALDHNRNFPINFLPNQNAAPDNRAQAPAPVDQGAEFYVPPLWKRFAAEIVDFLILLILKVLITYVALDFFDFINLEKYDFDLLRHEKMDYRKAMEVTSEIILLEIIHRFVVCIFEAICMHRGVYGNGGATPGKCVMRLRVVSCHSVVSVSHEKVRVIPAGDLGFGWAFLRAFIKNFSLAFIFPMCFTMFFFQHNRTAYDIICNSIVVEDPPQRIARN